MSYEPKSADEKKFANKHIIKKIKDGAGKATQDDDLFNAKNVKKSKRKPHHGYEPGEDKEVYEGIFSKKSQLEKNNAKKAGTREARRERLGKRLQRMSRDKRFRGDEYSNRQISAMTGERKASSDNKSASRYLNRSKKGHDIPPGQKERKEKALQDKKFFRNYYKANDEKSNKNYQRAGGLEDTSRAVYRMDKDQAKRFLKDPSYRGRRRGLGGVKIESEAKLMGKTLKEVLKLDEEEFLNEQNSNELYKMVHTSSRQLLKKIDSELTRHKANCNTKKRPYHHVQAMDDVNNHLRALHHSLVLSNEQHEEQEKAPKLKVNDKPHEPYNSPSQVRFPVKHTGY